MVAFAVSDQCADAHDGVVHVLRELVAEDRTNVRIRLADKVVGGREPTQVGHSLQVPDDDAWFHADRRPLAAGGPTFETFARRRPWLLLPPVPRRFRVTH